MMSTDSLRSSGNTKRNQQLIANQWSQSRLITVRCCIAIDSDPLSIDTCGK
jgi:hypothetical protein